MISKNSKSVKAKSESWVNSQKANDKYLKKGDYAPYAKDTMAKDIVTAKGEKFVRVHGNSSKSSGSCSTCDENALKVLYLRSVIIFCKRRLMLSTL